MHFDADDTIAAVATPPGRSALGIVRISGKLCHQIVSEIFRPKNEAGIVAFRPLLGKVLLSGEASIDEALLTFFQQPHSYTREDLAEISCHGNPLILEHVVERAIASGARLAKPGEFTYRAFLNGRLDLVQAEAVQDLISADTLHQTELALAQLDGRLSARFEKLKLKFVELISLMEGNLDFSEEQHYNFITADESLHRVSDILQDLHELIGTFDRGRMIRDGLNVAFVGKPNVGKSSLFNALLGQNRAIVTPVAGTTRDYLHERLNLGNYLVNLFDTAGIREGQEEIEKEGIARSRQVIENSELIVFVVDGSGNLNGLDYALWHETQGHPSRILVANKADLPGFRKHTLYGEESIPVSAVQGHSVEKLAGRITEDIRRKVHFEASDSLISSLRHRDILRKVVESVERAREAMSAGASEEVTLLELQEALREISQITGEVTIDDIYQQIFSNFCIGK